MRMNTSRDSLMFRKASQAGRRKKMNLTAMSCTQVESEPRAPYLGASTLRAQGSAMGPARLV